MNWGRGLFRLWLVALALWIPACALILDVVQAIGDYTGKASLTVPFAHNRIDIEVPGGTEPEALRKAAAAVLAANPELTSVQDKLSEPPPPPGFRLLTKDELGGMYVDTLIDDARKARSKQRDSGQDRLKLIAIAALSPPIALLIFGWMCLWALRGFLVSRP